MMARSLDPFSVPLQGVNLVEAAAGTGKTWTITALYLRLLLEQDLPVARILVVTYTGRRRVSCGKDCAMHW